MVNQLYSTQETCEKEWEILGIDRKNIILKRKKFQNSICDNKPIHIKKRYSSQTQNIHMLGCTEISRKTDNILLKLKKKSYEGFYFVRFNIDNKLIFQNFCLLR